MKNKNKSPALDGAETHDLCIARSSPYHCATTTLPLILVGHPWLQTTVHDLSIIAPLNLHSIASTAYFGLVLILHYPLFYITG